MINTEIENKGKGLFFIFNIFLTFGSFATALYFCEHKPTFRK